MTQTPARSGPTTPVAQSRPWRPCMLAIALGLGCVLAHAQPAPPPPSMAASAPLQNSALDAPMFYQLLVGEMEAQAGRDASAFEVMLDAARRTRDPALYQRAVDLAVRARSGDKALAAAKAWRDQPEHTAIRDAGRDRWYSWYDLHVASVTRSYDWVKP